MHIVFTAKKNKLDAEQLEIAYVLKKGFGCYFAFHPKVSEPLFRRFDAALSKLQKSDELQMLRRQLINSN